MRVGILLLGLFLTGVAASDPFSREALEKWSLDRAVQILNSSPWARTETFTRIVGGVGSGVSGEKEIFNTFYVRFLSARSVRAAYLRVQQIQHDYKNLAPQEKANFDELTRANLEMDVRNWIVVTVSFRSNDPNEESRVRQFFESEAAETLKNRAFLSSDSISQVELAAYFPPTEESVGAKFVFPRVVGEREVASQSTQHLTFELLELPGAGNPAATSGRGGRGRRSQNATPTLGVLRATFSVPEMIVEGELVL